MQAAADAVRALDVIDRIRAYRPRPDVVVEEPLRMTGPCAVCHFDRSGHARCASCGFLVGAKHVYETLTDGLCDGCQADAKRRR